MALDKKTEGLQKTANEVWKILAPLEEKDKLRIIVALLKFVVR
jgi:hypothetical protein